MKITIDSGDFVGPVAVTVAYFALWYSLLFGKQSRTKYRLLAKYKEEGKEFDRYTSNDPEMLAADRIVGNTHEQMVPFMVSMWLFAIFVSPFQATVLGGIYVVLRGIYPLLIGSHLSKAQPKRVFFVTGPCYLIIFSMLGITLSSLF